MPELDLHGVRHEAAELMIEDFVLRNSLPVKVITGNSPTMKDMLRKVLERHGMVCEPESYWNLGSLIVRDNERI